MLSLDNATTPEQLREFEARLRPAPARGRASPTCASRRSTGWASRCSTSAAASCAGPRAATAGSARTSPRISGPIRSIPVALRGRARGGAGARGPRRGLHAAGGVRAAEPRAWRRRARAAFANPRNAAAGAVRQKDPAVTARRPARHLRLSPEPGRAGSAFTSHWEAHPGAARGRVQDQPRARSAPRRSTPSSPYCAALEADARSARLRRRRRGGEGRLARAAAPAGLDRPSPALGHRLQVRRAAGHHHRARPSRSASARRASSRRWPSSPRWSWRASSSGT